MNQLITPCPKPGDLVRLTCPDDAYQSRRDWLVSFGEQLIKAHGCFCVVCPESVGIEQLDPEDMRRAGWVREDEWLKSLESFPDNRITKELAEYQPEPEDCPRQYPVTKAALRDVLGLKPPEEEPPLPIVPCAECGGIEKHTLDCPTEVGKTQPEGDATMEFFKR